jgi:hypothetical protein
MHPISTAPGGCDGRDRCHPAPPGVLLARQAARQDGLFTRAQALACGFSAGQVRRRLQSGRWQAVLGPVLAPNGARPTAELRDLAALLAVAGSVLAGPSAARRHGIPVADRRSWLIVRSGTRARLPGVRLLAEDVPTRDVVIVGGRPVTGVARTVFDCLRALPDEEAGQLLALARAAGWITAEQLAEQLHRFAGRRGAKRLARLCRCPPRDTRADPARLLLFETDRAAVELVGRSAWDDRAPAGPGRTRAARFRPADLRDRPEVVLLTLRTLLERPELTAQCADRGSGPPSRRRPPK